MGTPSVMASIATVEFTVTISRAEATSEARSSAGGAMVTRAALDVARLVRLGRLRRVRLDDEADVRQPFDRGDQRGKRRRRSGENFDTTSTRRSPGAASELLADARAVGVRSTARRTRRARQAPGCR